MLYIYLKHHKMLLLASVSTTTLQQGCIITCIYMQGIVILGKRLWEMSLDLTASTNSVETNVH